MTSAVEVYFRTRKPRDLPFNSFLARPVAAPLVALLEHTTVTPNQVTLAAAVLAGLSVLLLVAIPGYFGLLLAVAVYEASYVLDCVDGMLARLRGTQSTRGHLLDFLMDEIKAFAVLAGAATRLQLESGEVRFLYLGLVGLVALAAGTAMTTFLRRPEIAPPAAAAAIQAPRSLVRRVLGLVEDTLKFVVHYPSYIWVAALLGHLEWYLWPYVAVNVAYAGRTWLLIALRFGRE